MRCQEQERDKMDERGEEGGGGGGREGRGRERERGSSGVGGHLVFEVGGVLQHSTLVGRRAWVVLTRGEMVSVITVPCGMWNSSILIVPLHGLQAHSLCNITFEYQLLAFKVLKLELKMLLQLYT